MTQLTQNIVVTVAILAMTVNISTIERARSSNTGTASGLFFYLAQLLFFASNVLAITHIYDPESVIVLFCYRAFSVLGFASFLYVHVGNLKLSTSLSTFWTPKAIFLFQILVSLIYVGLGHGVFLRTTVLSTHDGLLFFMTTFGSNLWLLASVIAVPMINIYFVLPWLLDREVKGDALEQFEEQMKLGKTLLIISFLYSSTAVAILVYGIFLEPDSEGSFQWRQIFTSCMTAAPGVYGVLVSVAIDLLKIRKHATVKKKKPGKRKRGDSINKTQAQIQES
ncbi:hypothetical protein EDD86DRAFT_207763 [Gorgonomyces haynaldii]|nr:hypothetical protein EDD86DRAFT_207763 [Gorgonomyces haynaldii]